MKKHIGHDHNCCTHFRILSIDPTTNSVVLEYDINDWLRHMEPTQVWPWTDFLTGLMDGRLEILRAD